MVSASAVALGALACGLALASPMAYFKGGTMVMADVSDTEWDLGVNYSLTARDALGVRVGAMRSMRPLGGGEHGGGHGESAFYAKHETAELTYTRLLQRWNMPNGQVNVWFFGGIGAVRSNAFAGERFYASPSLQFDFETTRLYFAAKALLHRAKDVNSDTGVIRAGFAFWEPEYEDTQPWLIVEAKRTREYSEKIEITPMIRLINRRFFAEAGVNQDGKVRGGLMVVFPW